MNKQGFEEKFAILEGGFCNTIHMAIKLGHNDSAAAAIVGSTLCAASLLPVKEREVCKEMIQEAFGILGQDISEDPEDAVDLGLSVVCKMGYK